MAYTPTTWTTGDTITATAMNKIENGIANAGGGLDAFIYKERGTGDWQIIGDFNSALAKVQNGIPLIATGLAVCSYSSVECGWYAPIVLGTFYEDNTQSINLTINSVEGFIWTSNGISYYD